MAESDNGFVPGVNRYGDPCGNCKRLGRLCAVHDDSRDTKPPAITGRWEKVYFAALEKGHTRRAAAAKAGITERGLQHRRTVDQDFADREEQCYELGTASLLDIALERITDPDKPGDLVLKQLLAHRGIDGKKVHEVSGPDGGPIPVESMVPIDMLSSETKRMILRDLEKIEEAKTGTPAPIMLPESEVVRK